MKTSLALLLGVALTAGSVFGQGGFQGPGLYEITNLKSEKVLDLDRNDQTSLIQFSSRGTENQAWDIRPGPDGFVFLRNGMNGKALDCGGGQKSSPISAQPFNGGETQQWRLIPGKDGNALITSRLGRTLDVPDGSSRDGLRIQIYDSNGDSNQRFLLRRLAVRNWGWDRDRDRDSLITCSSNHGERVYCGAELRGREVRMTRQISGSPCTQGSTWGWDQRGIWVERGCRAEFSVGRR